MNQVTVWSNKLLHFFRHYVYPLVKHLGNFGDINAKPVCQILVGNKISKNRSPVSNPQPVNVVSASADKKKFKSDTNTAYEGSPVKK